MELEANETTEMQMNGSFHRLRPPRASLFLAERWIPSVSRDHGKLRSSREQDRQRESASVQYRKLATGCLSLRVSFMASIVGA